MHQSPNTRQQIIKCALKDQSCSGETQKQGKEEEQVRGSLEVSFHYEQIRNFHCADKM